MDAVWVGAASICTLKETGMLQWEYRATDLGDLPPRTNEITLLNAAGEDGWELVAISSNNVAYLKRQIEDPSHVADRPLLAGSGRRKSGD